MLFACFFIFPGCSGIKPVSEWGPPDPQCADNQIKLTRQVAEYCEKSMDENYKVSPECVQRTIKYKRQHIESECQYRYGGWVNSQMKRLAKQEERLQKTGALIDSWDYCEEHLENADCVWLRKDVNKRRKKYCLENPGTSGCVGKRPYKLLNVTPEGKKSD